MVSLAAREPLMPPIEFERAGLIAVEMAAHRQHRHRQAGKLFVGRIAAIPIFVLRRMADPFAELVRFDAVKFIHFPERQARFDETELLGDLKGAVLHHRVALGMPVDMGQPGHGESIEDVVVDREIEPDPCQRQRHDGGELCAAVHRRPLRIADPAMPIPSDLAVAEGLLRDPVDDIVPVVHLAAEWRELALRIATAAHVDRKMGIARVEK
nr:hypothetical protein [Sphingopyxis macrogoltabida]